MKHLLLGLSLAFAPVVEAPATVDRPNILLVVLDDVDLFNSDAVDTPNLDFLASQGISYRRAYAMPMCEMTRYGMLFSLYRGTKNGKVCLPPSRKTPPSTRYSLPKMFEGAGYATALFGKWHVGSSTFGPWEVTPNLHGFDTWRAGIPTNVNDCGGIDYWSWTRVDDGATQTSTEYQSTALRDSLLDWWANTSGPKFAFASLQAPHHPFHEPPAALVPPKYQGATTTRGMYEAMLASADTILGDLLDGIDLRTTWVLVIGDNGVAPKAAHPQQNSARVKTTTFEGGVNVPFVVAGPGLRRNFETTALAHVVDLLPTLAALAGTSLPPGLHLDGVSLVPTFASPESHVRSHVFVSHDFTGPTSRRIYDRSVVGRRYKMRRHLDISRFLNNEEYLYDLIVDPFELNPLDPTDPELAETAAHLRALIDHYE